MKVNEFKKIEEGFFSDLARVGSDTVDAAKSSSSYQEKEKEKFDKKVKAKTQSRYLQDFIEDLIVDLDAAIKGNAIDLNAKGLLQPSPSKASPSKAGFTPERIEKIRPILNKAIADGKIKNTTQLGSVLAKEYPEIWKNTTNKAEVINSFMSGDLTIMPFRPKLPKDPTPTTESLWYDRMNGLVESYISEQTTESISQWIMRWFAAYMKGVEWEGDKANVEAIATEIESSYKKDRGKAAISKLANSSWNLIKDVDTTPYGAKDVMNTNTPSNQTKLSDKQKADLIARIKRNDADAEKEVMSLIKEGR